jgi:hypothetical protein
MSNALAIATVTQTLVNVVTASLDGARVNGPQVSTLRPDDSSLQGSETPPRVNIFLYQVTPNTAWRNADLPTRRDDGSLVRRPQVALDLHYLFSFYGKDSTLEHQRLLGAVARGLHAEPVLQRSDIQIVEQMTDASNNNVLYLDSNLSEQIDLVRITPLNFSLDDMNKLWVAFPKANFVLSTAYMATVVLIETDEPPPAQALPVLKWNVEVSPFSLMLIDFVEPQSVVPSPPAPLSIALRGKGLGTANSVVLMTPGKSDPLPGTIEPSSTSDSIQVTLPTGLRPGVNTVQLVQTATPPVPSSPIISQSNIMVFVILPAILNLTSATPGRLTCAIWPPAGPKQQVSLVLNQQDGPQAFTLSADPHPGETDTFTFATVFSNGSVPSGTYLARMQVDSAVSRLTVDASGKFNGPTVDV